MIEPLRVAVVEDEAIVMMHLVAMLEDAGHTIVGTAMSAGEAIRLIDRTNPEVVLLDMHLKDGSSGLEVIRAIGHDDAVTVVCVTANATKLSDDLDGAAAVIAKPFNQTTILGSIAYLEECVHRPPPRRDLPTGLRMAPAYSARIARLR